MQARNTPEHKSEERKFDENDLELDDEKARLYRSAVRTLLYPASDFITAQHGIRELSTELKNPTESSFARLIKLVRYLATARYHGLKFEKQKLGKKATCTVRTDTNWAGSKIDRKSSDACISCCAMLRTTV